MSDAAKGDSGVVYNLSFSRRIPKWKPNASTPSPSGCRTLRPELPRCGGILDCDTTQERLAEVDKPVEDPDVWSDN
jgi:hypothetical protein